MQCGMQHFEGVDKFGRESNSGRAWERTRERTESLRFLLDNGVRITTLERECYKNFALKFLYNLGKYHTGELELVTPFVEELCIENIVVIVWVIVKYLERSKWWLWKWIAWFFCWKRSRVRHWFAKRWACNSSLCMCWRLCVYKQGVKLVYEGAT